MAVILDPFHAPCCVGNGRHLVTGRVSGTQGDLHDVRWVVIPKTSTWPKADFDPVTPQVVGKVDGEKFWFYVYGFEPSPFESLSISNNWVADSGIYSVAVATEPKFVSRAGKRLKRVASLALCQAGADTYFWVTGTLYANPGTNPASALLYSPSDGAFYEMSEYTVYVDWRSVLSPTWTNVLTLDIKWQTPVIDLRTLWDRELNPQWIAESLFTRAIRHATARQFEDIYAWLDDVYRQSATPSSTWSIPLWEELLGVPPSGEALTAAKQVALSTRRRVATGSREEFLDGLIALVGPITVVETYPNHSIQITMQGAVDPIKRKIGEAYIAQAKPAGLEILLVYSGGWIVGTSLVGDPL